MKTVVPYQNLKLFFHSQTGFDTRISRKLFFVLVLLRSCLPLIKRNFDQQLWIKSQIWTVFMAAKRDNFHCWNAPGWCLNWFSIKVKRHEGTSLRIKTKDWFHRPPVDIRRCLMIEKNMQIYVWLSSAHGLKKRLEKQ